MSEQHSCMRLDVRSVTEKLQELVLGSDGITPSMVSVRRALSISGSRQAGISSLGVVTSDI